jgi:DNA-binding transcriptional regulator YhcF (GntR family)
MINLDDRIFEEVKKPEQMWLLLHIAKRINKNMSCFPKNYTLAKDCGWSVNTVQKYKKELRELGLLDVQKRFVNNKQAGNNYIVKTNAVSIFVNLSTISRIATQNMGSQDVGTHDKGTQDVGNRSINKIEVLTNKNKDINGKKDLPETDPLSFETFWNNYNYKKNRKAAKKSWDRLTPTKKAAALAGVPQYLSYLNHSGHSQCHGATWINGERWNDDNSIENAKNNSSVAGISQVEAKDILKQLWEKHQKLWKQKYTNKAQSNYVEALRMFYFDNPQLKPSTDGTPIT